ncbi:RDD family protein [Streptomyces cinnamoneus]|uniref:RDD family protein n=1 Tax=Streptomyces cinnamoneus TaxID=53446 RepID=UPI0037960A28
MPGPGYYPDPSIPGYIRYWSGTAWVPGTSRPAPAEGEPMPAPPASVAASLPALAAPVPPTARQAPQTAGRPAEETGPVFLDEEPEPGQERAARGGAWQADATRQDGFGGENDRRVSWGDASSAAPEHASALPKARDPRLPPAGAPDAAAAPADGGAPASGAPGRGTLQMRPRPQGAAPSGPQTRPAVGEQRAEPAPAAVPAAQAWPGPRTEEPPAEPLRAASLPVRREESAPVPAAAVPSQAQAQAPASAPAPSADRPVGWAQQVHQLAQQQPQPGAGEGVMPWKPPVDDPFLRAARAQGRPAPLGRRLAARLLDTVVLGAVVSAVGVPLWGKSVEHIDAKVEQARQTGRTVTVWLIDGTTGTYLAIVAAVLLVVGVLYEALPTAKWGRTPGKKLFGLRVLDIESHDTPSFGRTLRRWLVYGGLGVLAVGVVNALWCLFDRPWRQCWHDKAAGTFVASADDGRDG